MGWIVGDSFDYYGSNADIIRSVWDYYNGGQLLAASSQTYATRFGSGQAFQPSSWPNFQKIMATNESTIYTAVATYYPNNLTVGGGPQLCFNFKDGATIQCTLCFCADGSVRLYRGDYNGTLVAQYNAAIPSQQWTHIQARVVIDPTNGELTVRRNGQVTDSFSLTGLNTRVSANSYANSISWGAPASWNFYVDDVLFYSGSAPAPNNWIGDVRAICLPPVADTAQKQFAPYPAVSNWQWGQNSNGAGNHFVMAANYIMFTQNWSPQRGGPIASVQTQLNANLTGHLRLAIYNADGPGPGTPGTVLAVANELTNPAAGAMLTWTFPSPVYVSPIRSYLFAIMSDASADVMMQWYNSVTWWQVARTYASGFPNPVTGMTLQPGSPMFYANVVMGQANCINVSEPQANGDTDYVYDSTNGDEDLYAIDSIPTTPLSIVGVVTKVYLKKSDAGPRQAQIRVKSGTTEVAGTDTAISSTYSYLSRVDVVDPNTSNPWTIAGVNALQIGHKVTL